MKRLGTWPDHPIQFPDDYCTAPAVMNHTGLKDVGAEIQERANRAFCADLRGDYALVKPVLHGDDVAVFTQVRFDLLNGTGDVMRFHRQKEALVSALQLLGQAGLDLERSGNQRTG